MKNKSIICFFCFFSIFLFAEPISQDSVTLKYCSGSTYNLIERSNWSKYIDGKYIGLTHRENRAQIAATGQTKNGLHFSGNFYVLEETLRDMTHSSRSIDAVLESSFTISASGGMTFLIDNGYPQLRSFPVYPDKSVQIGDSWQAEGFRIIDPLNNGKRTTLPIQVEYTFAGAEVYKDTNVFRIKAKYATRLNKYTKRKSDDENLVNATGTHDVDILVDAESGSAILILDRLDETFFYADGSSVRYKGSTALFTETPVPVQKDSIIPQINAIVAEKGADVHSKKESTDDVFGDVKKQPDSTPTPKGIPIESAKENEIAPFNVEETPQGIRLSVRDIRFLPDSDTILADEQWRLDAIAKTLALVPKGRFLIEGHTASVGKPSGEKELSLRRAKKIADELSKRGLLSEQFMYTGLGGTQPIASNATTEGRSLNRRVEITILD